VDISAKYVAKSFLWSVTAKVLDAGIKFISLPILLIYFGKQNFALITLATSINAYMNLLDMGVNTGAIKYFSEWISQGKLSLLDSVSRTSITFYGVIGIINALLLLTLSWLGMDLFSITPPEVESLRNLFFILAFFSIFNWSSSVFNQLLIANESLDFIQKVNIFKSLLNLALIYCTIQFEWSLLRYFMALTLLNSLVLLPFYKKSKSQNLIQSFIPAFDWVNFSIVFKYSLSIIAMAIFQVSANTLRPLILGIFSGEGLGIVADYRIMETITIFVISIGGIFTSILLPKTSRLMLENNFEKIENFAYKGTLFTSIICVILCLPFILCSQEILTIYVGDQYKHLGPWLIMWMLTILFFLHSTPINSIILATGKTRILVYSTAFSCIVSLTINALLCNRYGAGSAVIGYLVYITIQMSFYYFYFNNKVLGLNSFKVFKSFIIPTALGLTSLGIILLLNISLNNLIFQAIIKSLLWFILFTATLLLTKTIKLEDLKNYRN